VTKKLLCLECTKSSEDDVDPIAATASRLRHLVGQAHKTASSDLAKSEQTLQFLRQTHAVGKNFNPAIKEEQVHAGIKSALPDILCAISTKYVALTERFDVVCHPLEESLLAAKVSFGATLDLHKDAHTFSDFTIASKCEQLEADIRRNASDRKHCLDSMSKQLDDINKLKKEASALSTQFDSLVTAIEALYETLYGSKLRLAGASHNPVRKHPA
jgi:hypothetical protein